VAEEILAGAEEFAPLTEVKSTLLSSSLLGLRERGHDKAYLEKLPAELRGTLPFTPAGVWIPVDLILAHYAACDALRLSEEEVSAMGASVARLTRPLAAAATTAGAVGVTPWTVLLSTNRFWARIHRGSGMRIVKLGPKEARVEVLRTPVARYAYWRIGLRSIALETTSPFCRSMYVKELANGRDMVSYRMSWA
jgi:hypothetical protein